MLLLMMMIHTSSVLSEETTLTQQVSHTPLKCQSRSGPQRGTKVNGSHRGDNPLLKPTRIHIAEQSLPCPTTREHRELIGVKTMSLCTNGSFYCQECCQCFKNLNDKLKRRLSDPLHIHQTKSSQVIQNVFLAVRGLREDKSMHTLQWHRPVKMVHQTSSLHIESNSDRVGLLTPTHGQCSQQQSGQITLQSVLINMPNFSRPYVMQKSGKFKYGGPCHGGGGLELARS